MKRAIPILLAIVLLGCNSGSSKAPTLPDIPVVPDTPIELTDIKITWSDNSDNEDEFSVSRRFSDEVEFTIINTLPEDSTTYTDEDLDLEYTYCYKITASNEYGSSDSDEVCTK